MKATRLLLLALCCAHLSASADSQVPALISYQGHLPILPARCSVPPRH